jgi:hypothetical protein
MSIATDMLALYIEAEQAVLAGQSFAMGGRSLTMANLAEIRAGRREWEARAGTEKARAAGIPTLGGINISHGRCR